MQAFNQELIQCIEELKTTKSNLENQIETEESEKIRLQNEIERANARINQLNDSLNKKGAMRLDYERTIQETESAYMKILESSQLLLTMVKRESATLDKTMSSGANEFDTIKGKCGQVMREVTENDAVFANCQQKVDQMMGPDHVKKKKHRHKHSTET